jgi:N-acetylmuramoyl-L-alanine amidase
MPFPPRELFARMLKCEAGGEGDDGMKAVACVIMNRVNVPYGEYLRIGQGDLRKILLQRGQFDCASSVLAGRPNLQTIWANPPEQIHYDIADWALSGNRLPTLESALWYFNPFIPTCPTVFPRNGSGSVINRIGDHCFYIPTERYKST